MKPTLLFIKIIALTLIGTVAHSQTHNAYYQSVVDNASNSNILEDLTSFEIFGIKDVGSTELTNTENWITTRYQNLGYTDITLQSFSYSSGTSNNVIVTKMGTMYPNTFIIIDAHYDTKNGPGTNDNGSGTVLLLEIARLLKNVNTEYSIKFIHFSGEEDGLVGSNYYVNNTVNPENLDIRLVFNVDEVGGINGTVNDTIICEEDRSNPPSNNSASSVMTTTLANCVELYSNLTAEISYAYSSDYIPFENNGEIITGLYEKNVTPHAHTPSDVLVNMDPNYLFEVTKGALGAMLEFAISSNPLSVPDAAIEKIRIYPNPSSNGIINVHLNNVSNEESSITIYDVLGKSVYQNADLKTRDILDLKTLQSGMYFVHIKTENAIIIKKIVLK